MKKYVLLVACFMLAIAFLGCANKNAPKEETIEAQGQKFSDIAKDRTIRVVSEHYVGVKRVPPSIANAPELQTRITLRANGSLAKIADTIMTLVPLTVNVVGDHDISASASAQTNKPVPGIPRTPEQSLIEDLVQSGNQVSQASIPGTPASLAINYSGRLVGLLEQISMQSGYGWDYSRKDKTITFAKTMVRTFALHAAPGEVAYDNSLTDKNRSNNTSTSSLGNNVNATVSNNTEDSQISQTYKSKISFDVWQDTLKTVQTLLSSIGKATSNVAAGTITVRDRPVNLRMVENFIDEVNSRYSRQVALKVNVYSLDIKDSKEAGIDLQVLFNPSKSDFGLAAGSLSNMGLIGTASAAIVSGEMKDSAAVLKALAQWGNATQVTSAGVVTMNNQPAPIEAIRRTAYLAATSQETTDYGSTTELTPGEITTGYSMTVTPHILPSRKVILQYTVRLASLEAMQEFSSGESRIQLPQVATRAFSQKANMMMGQTLVLAGFEQATQQKQTGAGILSLGRSADYNRTLLVITIQLENASPEIAEAASTEAVHAAD